MVILPHVLSETRCGRRKGNAITHGGKDVTEAADRASDSYCTRCHNTSITHMARQSDKSNDDGADVAVMIRRYPGIVGGGGSKGPGRSSKCCCELPPALSGTHAEMLVWIPIAQMDTAPADRQKVPCNERLRSCHGGGLVPHHDRAAHQGDRRLAPLPPGHATKNMPPTERWWSTKEGWRIGGSIKHDAGNIYRCTSAVWDKMWGSSHSPGRADHITLRLPWAVGCDRRRDPTSNSFEHDALQ